MLTTGVGHARALAAVNADFRPKDGRQSRRSCRLGKAHHTVETMVIGECQSRQLQSRGFNHQFFGITGSV